MATQKIPTKSMITNQVHDHKTKKTNSYELQKMPPSTRNAHKNKKADELKDVIRRVCRKGYHRYDEIHTFDDHKLKKVNYNILFRETTKAVQKEIPNVHALDQRCILKLVENEYKNIRKFFVKQASKIRHYDAFHHTDYLFDCSQKLNPKKKNKPKKINPVAPLMLPTQLFDPKSKKFKNHVFTREELHAMYEEKAHKFKFMNGKGCYIDHAIYHQLGDGCKVLDINDDTFGPS